MCVVFHFSLVLVLVGSAGNVSRRIVSVGFTSPFRLRVGGGGVTQPQFKIWLTKLLGYNFKFLYESDLQNKVGDPRSRVNCSIELLVLLTSSLVDVATTLKKWKKMKNCKILLMYEGEFGGKTKVSME